METTVNFQYVGRHGKRLTTSKTGLWSVYGLIEGHFYKIEGRIDRSILGMKDGWEFWDCYTGKTHYLAYNFNEAKAILRELAPSIRSNRMKYMDIDKAKAKLANVKANLKE